jgi:DNA-binding GntR family transcriptional regulator
MAIAFEFPPGGRVNELAVAKRIGVSRTPLREALNRLTADGFLTFSRQQGFFRKPLSVKAVQDLYEWREQIELGVVRLAIERLSEAALDEIEAYVRASSDLAGKTAKEALAIDERFHVMLADLTDNSEITDALKNVNDRMRFVRWVNLESRREFALTYQLALVHALRARDLARAEKLTRDHVSLTPEQIVSTVKDAFARIYMNRDSAFIPPV